MTPAREGRKPPGPTIEPHVDFPELELATVSPRGRRRTRIDEEFPGLERIQLDPVSWVDFAPTWVDGSDALFAELLEARDWGQRSRPMYERQVKEPRLTSLWRACRLVARATDPRADASGLVKHYGIELDSVGFNLYRDGRDSVAWHGDRISKEIPDPIVALVSVGEPRRFLLRPKEGGKSRAFQLGVARFS